MKSLLPPFSSIPCLYKVVVHNVFAQAAVGGRVRSFATGEAEGKEAAVGKREVAHGAVQGFVQGADFQAEDVEEEGEQSADADVPFVAAVDGAPCVGIDEAFHALAFEPVGVLLHQCRGGQG